jgi:hypothetical protein
VLPDGKRVKYPLVPNLHQQAKRGYFHDLGPQYSVPPYPLPEQHFYSEREECDPAEPQATDPATTDPFVSGEDLPLPSGVEKSPSGAHVISDQPK